MGYPTEIERTARVLRLAVITAILALALWLTGRVLLEIFAGLLVAVMLRGLSEQLSRRTHLSRRWALLMVSVGLLGLLAATIYFLTPRLIAQGFQVFHEASLAIDELSQRVSEILPDYTFGPNKLPNLPQLSSGVVHAGATVTDAIITPVIIVFVGFYAAVSSPLYVGGFVRLFPRKHRVLVREVLNECGRSLEWWLFGRALIMLAVTVLTLIGLSLLSMPLAFTLSLLAGLLTFIPYIGPLISAVPALLIAFVQSPILAAYVALVYVAAHILEGYILAPLIQQRAVHMPPALMLCGQVMLGTLFGIAGFALAAPLTVVVMVLTQIVYLRDVLGEPVRLGHREAPATHDAVGNFPQPTDMH